MRNWLGVFITVIVTGFSPDVRAAEPSPSPTEWQSISNKDGVATFRRQRAKSNESKAVGEIAASTDLVRAVLDDVESYASFMPYVVECRVLRRDGDSMLAYQRISAPLASDRDFTVRIRSTANPVEGGMSYLRRWQAENALGPAEKLGVVRVNLCEGSWLLEPIGPNTTRATYLIYTDSGGLIPAFIKNPGSQIGLRKMFAAIRKQVRDPKYAKRRN